MRVVKAIMLGAVVALLGVAFSACGTGGAAAARADNFVAVPLSGEWFDVHDDYGGSSINRTEVEVDGMAGFHIYGTVGSGGQWGGYVSFNLNPDERTLELLRSADAISFMIRGDGQRFFLSMDSSAVTDWGHFATAFDTVAGEAIRITAPIRTFFQPSWAAQIGRLRMETVTGMGFGAHEAWRPEPNSGLSAPFEITIWDISVHVPAEVAAAAPPVPVAAAPAALVPAVEYDVAEDYDG